MQTEKEQQQIRQSLSENFLCMCDQLWENRPNCPLLQNEIEARKVKAVITAVGNQKN